MNQTKATRWSPRLLGLVVAGALAAGCYLPPEDGVPPSQQDPRAPARGEAPREQEPAPAEADEAPAEPSWGEEPAWGDDEPAEPARGREGDSPRHEANRLANRANEAMDRGNPQQAARHLEEAVELQPERAVFWHNLAIVNYRLGQNGRAERLGLQAVDLAEDDLELLREAWWLVAAARKAQGDSQGARDAAAAARQFGEVGELEPGELP